MKAAVMTRHAGRSHHIICHDSCHVEAGPVAGHSITSKPSTTVPIMQGAALIGRRTVNAHTTTTGGAS